VKDIVWFAPKQLISIKKTCLWYISVVFEIRRLQVRRPLDSRSLKYRINFSHYVELLLFWKKICYFVRKKKKKKIVLFTPTRSMNSECKLDFFFLIHSFFFFSYEAYCLKILNRFTVCCGINHYIMFWKFSVPLGISLVTPAVGKGRLYQESVNVSNIIYMMLSTVAIPSRFLVESSPMCKSHRFFFSLRLFFLFKTFFFFFS